jgi:hypothetical protein
VTCSLAGEEPAKVNKPPAHKQTAKLNKQTNKQGEQQILKYKINKNGNIFKCVCISRKI